MRPQQISESTTEASQRAIDTYVLLRRTHDAVARRVEKEMSRWNITTIKYGVLRHLSESRATSLTELSQKLFRGNSNTTTLIDRMERDGLVRRVPHDEDRRVIMVEITEKGQELRDKVKQPYREFLTRMMACYEGEELEVLDRLLRRLKERVETDGLSR
ncbi:MAG: MarR family transcriptional regulator [Chloroflexi bacterium]|nr:MarR family transcriptional regulator [Chloroflexota bacterium]MCL5074303.1 MarR family transcriptional regulator [Chloroflexota bacterium]